MDLQEISDYNPPQLTQPSTKKDENLESIVQSQSLSKKSPLKKMMSPKKFVSPKKEMDGADDKHTSLWNKLFPWSSPSSQKLSLEHFDVVCNFDLQNTD